MALETFFGELSARLERLHDTLVGLRLAVVEDRPLEGAGALLDRLGEVTLDLEGRSNSALEWQNRGRRAAQYPVDLDSASQALAACQAEIHRLQREFSTGIGSCRRITEIVALERERGKEWAGWVRSVLGSIDQYLALSHEVNEAFFDCWREVAERAGTGAIPSPRP